MSTIKRVGILLFCLVLIGSVLSLVSASTISEVKIAAVSGTQVTVTGVVIYTEPYGCYLESADRSSGMWVRYQSAPAIVIGSHVTATGTYSTTLGEPAISGATLTLVPGGSIIAPFAMNNSAVGGNLPDLRIWDYKPNKIPGDGHDWSWVPAKGVPNAGLLIKIWGTINAVYSSAVNGARWFYMDDGYGASADLADQGILVYSDKDVEQGQFVAVTGVSSVEKSFDDPTRLLRVIRIRNADDVQVLRQAQKPDYPFSDEFDSAQLDSRWAIISNKGSLSTTSSPGWLAITALPRIPDSITPESGCSPEVMQMLCGDYDIDIQLRAGPFSDADTKQQIHIVLKIPDSAPAMNRDASSYYLASVEHSYVNGLSRSVINYGNAFAPLTGDNVWLHMRMRSGTMYVQYSLDGNAFSAERQLFVGSGATGLSIFSRAIGDSLTGVPFTGYVNHFRYTRITEQGG